MSFLLLVLVVVSWFYRNYLSSYLSSYLSPPHFEGPNRSKNQEQVKSKQRFHNCVCSFAALLVGSSAMPSLALLPIERSTKKKLPPRPRTPPLPLPPHPLCPIRHTPSVIYPIRSTPSAPPLHSATPPPHSIRSFPLMPSRFTSFPLSTPRSAHFTPTRSARSRAPWNSGSARRADPLHFVGPRRPGRSPRRPRGRCPPHRGHADRCPPNGQQSDHPRRWVSARGTTARAGHCDHHGDGGR